VKNAALRVRPQGGFAATATIHDRARYDDRPATGSRTDRHPRAGATNGRPADGVPTATGSPRPPRPAGFNLADSRKSFVVSSGGLSVSPKPLTGWTRRVEEFEGRRRFEAAEAPDEELTDARQEEGEADPRLWNGAFRSVGTAGG
jgi:hypothetical protein